MRAQWAFRALFWFALIIVQVFAVSLRWFPVAGYVPITRTPSPSSYLTLLAGTRPAQNRQLFRYARTGMLDAARQPVSPPRSLGVPERTVLSLRLPQRPRPSRDRRGPLIAGLLGGAVLTETIFNLPASAALLLTAVRRRGYPLIEGASSSSPSSSSSSIVVDLIYVASIADPLPG